MCLRYALLFINSVQGKRSSSLLLRCGSCGLSAWPSYGKIHQNLNVSTFHGEAHMETQNNVMGDAYTESGVQFEDNAAIGGIVRNNSIQNSQTITDHQLRRLLEPLRRLHSLKMVHIEGRLTEEYKAALIASMCGPEASDLGLFNTVYAMYNDAMKRYDIGDIPSAIPKMKCTLDIINDYKRTIPLKSSSTVPATGYLRTNAIFDLGEPCLGKSAAEW